MTIAEMSGAASPWLDASGPHSDSVVSSRVRLARNLRGIPYTHRARPEDLGLSLEIALKAAAAVADAGSCDHDDDERSR